MRILRASVTTLFRHLLLLTLTLSTCLLTNLQRGLLQILTAEQRKVTVVSKAIHLNDSMNEMGSHKDRHQKIGEGNIGLDAMKRIINHPALMDKPFILETPNDEAGYANEIALLRSISEN